MRLELSPISGPASGSPLADSLCLRTGPAYNRTLPRCTSQNGAPAGRVARPTLWDPAVDGARPALRPRQLLAVRFALFLQGKQFSDLAFKCLADGHERTESNRLRPVILEHREVHDANPGQLRKPRQGHPPALPGARRADSEPDAEAQGGYRALDQTLGATLEPGPAPKGQRGQGQDGTQPEEEIVYILDVKEPVCRDPLLNFGVGHLGSGGGKPKLVRGHGISDIRQPGRSSGGKEGNGSKPQQGPVHQGTKGPVLPKPTADQNHRQAACDEKQEVESLRHDRGNPRTHQCLRAFDLYVRIGDMRFADTPLDPGNHIQKSGHRRVDDEGLGERPIGGDQQIHQP